MNQYGHGKGTTHGGFSQFSVVKARYCYQLKTNISFLDAVLLEPMGIHLFKKYNYSVLTLIGMKGHTYYFLSFLDQILSADFFIQKF